jgi:hypothetical protein
MARTFCLASAALAARLASMSLASSAFRVRSIVSLDASFF